MKIDIIEKKDNLLLNRKDFTLLIKHDKTTPSKKDLKKELATTNRVDESQIIINFISTKKGITESIAKINILNEKPKIEEKKQEENKNETQIDKSK